MAKNYLQQIVEECLRLDTLADEFLKDRKDRDDKSTMDLWEENTELGLAWYERCKHDPESIPDVVISIANRNTPYGPKTLTAKGSLAFKLGLSVVSLDAHAWRLNDFLKGKADTPDLPFGYLAEVD
jgi:hypothetical protein